MNPTDNIKLEEFNSCPGKEAVAGELQKSGVFEYATVADTDIEFWQNADDTLVLAIPVSDQKVDAFKIAKFGELIYSLAPDEYHVRKHGQVYYIRIWWD